MAKKKDTDGEKPKKPACRVARDAKTGKFIPYKKDTNPGTGPRREG